MARSLKTPFAVAAALALLVLGTLVGAYLGPRLGLASSATPAPASEMSIGAAPAGMPAAASSATSAERQALYWYDPMFPTQRFDKPGKSPFMDMQLVPRYAEEAASPGSTADAGPAVAVSTQARQALGLRLATVEQRNIGATVEAAGSVGLNERDVAVVQARTAGFVERVFGHAPGDVVAAGAPLAEVLNPEWLGAQQEFLALRSTGDAALTQAARARLALLGLPAALVEQVERSGQAQARQTIAAPISGVITELGLRQGMSIAAGATLARINGLGTVWLEAAVPEAQAGAVRPGQAAQARFTALPGEVVKGRVIAVLPEANRDTRSLRLRIELPNPGQRLKPGYFAQVTLQGPQRSGLVLPAEALIRNASGAIVYLALGEGRYRPVAVEVGQQVGDLVVLRSGLVAGQQVVVSGQFLLDSEASLAGVVSQAAPMADAASMPAAATMPAMPSASGASR